MASILPELTQASTAAAYSISLSWAPYIANSTFRVGQTQLSLVSWSHNETFSLFEEKDFAAHHLLKFSRVSVLIYELIFIIVSVSIYCIT